MADKVVYRVFVDDNFHYMDEDYRDELGTFEELASAVAACKGIVDNFLIDSYRQGMTPEELWKQYRSFGEDPFVVGPYPGCSGFSAWAYAKQRCNEMCSQT